MKRTRLVVSHVYNTKLRYRRNEGRLKPSTNFSHFGYRDDQYPRQFLLVKIACLENEFSNVVSNNARVLDALVPDVLISGEQHPSFLAYEREPDVIRRTATKMGQVSLVQNAVLGENF